MNDYAYYKRRRDQAKLQLAVLVKDVEHWEWLMESALEDADDCLAEYYPHCLRYPRHRNVP